MSSDRSRSEHRGNSKSRLRCRLFCHMRDLVQYQSSFLMPFIQIIHSSIPLVSYAFCPRLLPRRTKIDPILRIAFVTGRRRDGCGSVVQSNSKDGRPHRTYCDSTESLFERIGIRPDVGECRASMIWIPDNLLAAASRMSAKHALCLTRQSSFVAVCNLWLWLCSRARNQSERSVFTGRHS